MRENIAVLDFGSQYAHLIAKRLRLMGYYSAIRSPSSGTDVFKHTKGIILSGGPSSVYEKNIPEFNEAIFGLDIPVLGLCYGHQLMCRYYGGRVEKGRTAEFGIASLEQKKGADCPLFKGLSFPTRVWMSHQDEVTLLPDGFECTAFTKDCAYAAVQDGKRKRFGLQFHTEVKDTAEGNAVLQNFAQLCGMDKNWNQDAVLEGILDDIRERAKDRSVLLFLSGGVDSTVAFALLNKALGQDRVKGLHIDNGFMRKNESASVAERYRGFGFTNFITEDASKTFLKAVAGETDPQKKRRAVGETFIHVRDEVVKKLGLNEDEWLLAQGTLYPDIIESGGTENSHTIKTHHNRVAGIQSLIDKGLIIEPLKDLYKDEVRLLGKKLGLSDELIMRHPFPGPGLSINVLGSSGKTDEKEFKAALHETEKILPDVQKICGAVQKIGVLPVKSVGVQGDFRTYRFPAVLYANDAASYGDKKPCIQTLEKLFGAKSASPSRAHEETAWDALEKSSAAITNACASVNRTVLALYEKAGCSLHEAYCTKERLDQIREADAVMLDELRKAGRYGSIFQHLTINLPYAAQSGHCALVLRPVVSEDVMTARFAHMESAILLAAVERILNFDFVDALYYDITNKPPATFGWE